MRLYWAVLWRLWSSLSASQTLCQENCRSQENTLWGQVLLQRARSPITSSSKKIAFLWEFSSKQSEEIMDAAEKIKKMYPDDLDALFPEEFLHFTHWANGIETILLTSSPHFTRGTCNQPSLMWQSHWECISLYLWLFVRGRVPSQCWQGSKISGGQQWVNSNSLR